MNIINQVKNAIPSVISIINKYRFAILFIYFILINPATFSYICNYFDTSFILYLAVLVATIACFGISIKRTYTNPGMFFYCCVYLFLTLHDGFDFNCFDPLFSFLGLSILSVIIFYKRNFFFAIPIVCFLFSLILPDFYNNHIFSTLIIYFLAGAKNDNTVLSKSQKLFCIISGILFYLITTFQNYADDINGIANNVMIWECYSDYFHFGFIPRGLVATIRYITLGPNTSFYRTFFFLYFFQILCIFGIFFTLYLLWKESAENHYAKLLCLAIFCSETIRNAVNTDMAVYFDNLLILLFLICVLLLVKNKLLYLIPIFVSIAMLTHHGFGLFLFPALLTILAFCYLTSKSLYRSRLLCISIFSTVIVLTLFSYFHFFAHENIILSFSEACKYIATYTGHIIPDNIDSLSTRDILAGSGYLFVNLKYILYNGKQTDFGIQEHLGFSVQNSALLILFLIPIFYLCVLNTKSISSHTKFDRFIHRAFPFILPLTLISYLETDYGRWNSFLILSLLSILLASLLIKGEESWINQIPEKYRKTICKGLIVLMVLIPNMGVWAT